MVHYRRDKTPAAVYFFTLSLKNRQSNLLTKHIALLGESFRHTRQHQPFKTRAVVVLPDHLHTLWELPDGDDDYSTRWRHIKTHFTRSLIKNGEPVFCNARGEFNIWQRRFWEHRIRNETDLCNHVDYIHHNPVKHGHVTKVMDWPYSSFHKFVKNGDLSPDWAGGYSPERNFGE
ncbi:REP-associated tyrosine transposase [Legionella oakridgensis]|uniref:Transposase-like protein n=3 Tax=Legionella oakridgensis TaxID=29423 RepID=W0BD79_9GAMM|nr:transposase [Legionella oakridgensis]AHE67800.1 transposase-like protein [Legionella oakridgensis ATCC 33761 = DSM 21215]ETO92604.1 transposase [Legionella oakridgensis RV-2-2007]KTD44046.1 Transposase IS200 like protein [Legionella oakridgensis]STY20814.1 Transposase and inactivated derivatives [Legionella longbeachae]